MGFVCVCVLCLAFHLTTDFLLIYLLYLAVSVFFSFRLTVFLLSNVLYLVVRLFVCLFLSFFQTHLSWC